jgi:hypothetical protein
MSYGLTVKNDLGLVLISDTVPTMHFVGQAYLVSNTGTRYGDFYGYSGPNDGLDGHNMFTYRINSSIAPKVFIRPRDYSKFYAVTRLYSSGGSTWDIEVLMSHGYNGEHPQIFCFAPSTAVGTSGENYGLVVKDSSGILTFDSRLSPLAITAGLDTYAPQCPCNSGCPGTTSGHPWNYAALDWDFKSSSRYNSYEFLAPTSFTDLMFSADSFAQSVQARQMNGYKRSSGGAYGSDQEHWSTALWWVMYRNTFRLSNGQVHSGWTNTASAYRFTSTYEDGGWFGGGGGGWSTGTLPYPAKSINTGERSLVLIADATRYGG